MGEALISTLLAFEQTEIARTGLWIAGVGAAVNFFVVLAAFAVPWLQRRWDAKSTREFMLSAIESCEDGLVAIIKADKRLQTAVETEQLPDADLEVVRRSLAAARRQLEFVTTRAASDSLVLALISQTTQLLTAAERLVDQCLKMDGGVSEIGFNRGDRRHKRAIAALHGLEALTERRPVRLDVAQAAKAYRSNRDMVALGRERRRIAQHTRERHQQ